MWTLTTGCSRSKEKFLRMSK
jgi:hypothetical protein